jgi:hypothetical protein
MPPAPAVTHPEGIGCAHERSYDLQLPAIVIMIVPIMIPVPAAAFHVPPPVVLSPATLPCLVQFMAPVISLPAVVSMMFDRFMELVIRERRAPLAIAIIGRRAGSS